MSAPQALGISYRRATAVSVALHLLAIAAFLWAWATPLRDPGMRERVATEVVRISRFTISFRARPRVVTATTGTVAVFAPQSPRKVAHVFITIAHAPTPLGARRAAIGTHGVARANAPPRAIARATTSNLIVDAMAAPGAPRTLLAHATVAETAAPVVAAQETATPAPVVLAASKSANELADVPSGGWGQSFSKPLVADDDALASLRATLHATGPLVAEVTVDDTGHATHATLPASLADDVRAEIERRLLALRYVPAECNGLRCSATLSIAL